MQNLVILQIIVYLFVSPIVISFVGKSEGYRFDFSLIFLVSFCIGLILVRQPSYPARLIYYKRYPYIPVPIKVASIVMALMYINTVIEYGLLDRRQGSEVMALLFAGLPLIQLAILRIFEILFYPMLFIILVGLQYDRDKLLRVLLVVFLCAFPFTGVLDSRAKLLMPLLYYYVLFIAPRPDWKPISRKIFISAFILAGFAFFIMATIRLGEFDDLSGYLLADFVSRLDGLEFSSKLASEGTSSVWGTMDFNVFLNFMSAVPFLESATELKAAGMTSSKNYLLQEVLGSSQFDINNSMITDLYYFGGYFFLVVGGIFYGYLVKRFDLVMRSNLIWKGRASLAFMMSFMINAIRFESDYFGVILSVFRDFLIFYGVSMAINLMKIPESSKVAKTDH